MKQSSILKTILSFILTLVIADVYASHPANFDTSELVRKADFIFEGTVVNVEYRTSDVESSDDVAMPHTFVTYEIGKNFKGRSSESKLITLRFRGGPDDSGNTLILSGVPLFQTGDQDIVFVSGNGTELSPIVGHNFGRFRMAKEAIYSDSWQEVWLHKDGRISHGKLHPEKTTVTHRIGVNEFSFETKDETEWVTPRGAQKLTVPQFRKFLSDSIEQQFTPHMLSTLGATRSINIHERFKVGKARPVAAPAAAPVASKIDPEAALPIE